MSIVTAEGLAAKKWLEWEVPDFKGSKADFTPQMLSLFYTTNFGVDKLPDRAAVVKNETGEYIGHVKTSKVLFKPSEFFSFAAEIIQNAPHNIVYRPPFTHQSLFTEIPVIVPGDNDYYMLIEFRNSFIDLPSQIIITPVRKSCQNGVILFDKLIQVINLPNLLEPGVRSLLTEKLEKCIGSTLERLSGFVSSLIAYKLDPLMSTAILNACYPEEGVFPSTAEVNAELKRRILKAMNAPDLLPFAGTGYALYNALTDVYQHDRLFVDTKGLLLDDAVTIKQAYFFNTPSDALKRVLNATGVWG